MKIASLFAGAVLVAGNLLLTGLPASALTYTDGDLFLGFRASGGDGAQQAYLVNIGQVSQYTASGTSFVALNLGDIAADLSATFGPNWATRGDLFWSISGTDAPGEVENTLFVTRQRVLIGSPATPWIGRSPSSQGVTNSRFKGLAGAYRTSAGNAASAVGTIQNATSINSYASYQPGGTPENSAGISFGAFNPTIEGSFVSGTGGSVLDLFKVVPVFDQAASRVGAFTINAAGELTFTPPAAIDSTVVFEPASVSAPEDVAGGKVAVRLRRTGNYTASFSIPVSTADGTALAGTDYTGQTESLVSFLPGQTEAFAEIPLINRPGFQGDRQFTVSLGAPPANVNLGGQTTSTVTIQEGAPNPSGSIAFSASSFAFPNLNGQGNPNLLTLNLTRTGGTTGAVAVNVDVTGGTLASGTDFTFTSPTVVNFPAGAASATVNIQLNAIQAASLPGSIVLGLSNATGGANVGLQSTATVTVGEFGTLAFSSATYQITEPSTGTATLSVTVNRAGGTSGAVTAQVAATGGTASNPADFTGTPATLSWADGETGPKTFDIVVNSDAIAEPAGETVLIALSDITGGAAAGTQGAATVNIVEPDSAAPTVVLNSPKANGKFKGSTVTFAGKATDNQNVARVEIVLNGGDPVVVTPPSATASFDFTTTIPAEQGANSAVVTVFDTQGNASAPLSRSFTFTNVRPELAGKYNGLVSAGVGALSTFDSTGLISLSVTPTGQFSGKVSISGVAVPVKGVFLTGGAAQFAPANSGTLELKKKKGTPSSLGFLSLSIDTAGGNRVTGQVANSGGTVVHAEIENAAKAQFKPGSNPVPTDVLDPATDKGKYTAVIQTDAEPNGGLNADSYPQGHGFASVSVKKNGVVSIAGKLADGTPFKYSNALSQGKEWPVYVPLYKKGGFLAGNVQFDASQALSDAAGENLTWVRPATTGTLYVSGWPNGIGGELLASKFVAPKKPGNADTVLGPGLPGAGSPSTANIEIGLNEGGLITPTLNDASIDAASKLTVIGAAAGATGADGLSLKFVPGKGTLKGAFAHPGVSKPVKYEGIVYQKLNSAFGYFLYKPSSGAALSGAVEINKK